VTIYKDDLERVYKLIEKEENWTKGVHARDANGRPVDANSDDAVCWCLDGAFRRCGLSILDSERVFRVKHTPAYNDAKQRKHKEILKKLRSAIKRAPVRPS
jgi:hypothetical protein